MIGSPARPANHEVLPGEAEYLQYKEDEHVAQYQAAI
jgi:hypothetical protein